VPRKREKGEKESGSISHASFPGGVMQSTKTALIGVAILLASTAAPRSAAAAETWLEMQSPHFKALSNAGEGSTRNVLWQFEQIRAAMAALWPSSSRPGKSPTCRRSASC
jgi:hypothetical protein